MVRIYAAVHLSFGITEDAGRQLYHNLLAGYATNYLVLLENAHMFAIIQISCREIIWGTGIFVIPKLVVGLAQHDLI